MVIMHLSGMSSYYHLNHCLYRKVAIKVFNSTGTRNEEVKILIRLTHHQNIVRILGLFVFSEELDSQCGYVMEFMATGSLASGEEHLR